MGGARLYDSKDIKETIILRPIQIGQKIEWMVIRKKDCELLGVVESHKIKQTLTNSFSSPLTRVHLNPLKKEQLDSLKSFLKEVVRPQRGHVY